MRELSLHLLDIAENSVAANATEITILVKENTTQDRLFLSVIDNGKGMDKELLIKIYDPFITSRTTRKVGLGIPLLKAAAEACNGYLTIDSKPGDGTVLKTEFQRSHIDRMPIGNLADTILQLLIAYPKIHWILKYVVDSDEFILDDKPIKTELEGISLTEPEVISFLREYIDTGINNIKPPQEYCATR